MKTKTKRIGSREFILYEDGRVFAKEFTTLTGHKRRAKFLSSCKTGDGYRRCQASISGKMHVFLEHRVVAEVCIGNFSESEEVDHINGIKDDNNPPNLRMLSHKQNCRSFKKQKNDLSSKYRGVHFRAKTSKWIAQITKDGTRTHLGCFSSEEEAATAFDRAASEMGYSKEALNLWKP